MMMLFYCFLSALFGGFCHWLKKTIKQEEVCLDFFAYLFKPEFLKYTVNTTISIVVSIVGLYLATPELAVTNVFECFLLGYTLDSALNKSTY